MASVWLQTYMTGLPVDPGPPLRYVDPTITSRRSQGGFVDSTRFDILTKLAAVSNSRRSPLGGLLAGALGLGAASETVAATCRPLGSI
jgi:hypothetical protein